MTATSFWLVAEHQGKESEGTRGKSKSLGQDSSAEGKGGQTERKGHKVECEIRRYQVSFSQVSRQNRQDG